jgi:hypothetical protein
MGIEIFPPVIGGGSSVTISLTAPASPSAGDLWWKTDEGQLKIYYTDADSSQWVDAMNFGGGAGGAGGGMTRIAQVICAGSPATIAFSAIPQGYSSLRLILTGRDTNTGVGDTNTRLKLNADAVAANYTSHYLLGQGTAVSAANVAATIAGMYCGGIPGTSGNAEALGQIEFIFPLYSNAVFQKLVQIVCVNWHTATPLMNSMVITGVWKSAAPITAITLTAGGTAFVNGTTATLYGM